MADRKAEARDRLESRVIESVRSLVAHPAHLEWLGEESPEDGDLVVFNNSFLYRDLVKTRKSPHYLGWLFSASREPDADSVVVTTVDSFNTDFKRWSKKLGNVPVTSPLSDALTAHLPSAEGLVFVLLGTIREEPCSVPLRHSLFSQLRFDPALPSIVEVRAGPPASIAIRDLVDPEAVWTALEEASRKAGVLDPQTNLPENLEAPLADAFERLQAEAFLLGTLPRRDEGLEPESTLLGRMKLGVRAHVEEYERALSILQSDPAQVDARNEVLRIAYNFASEVDKLLGLVVSVCDLRPPTLWYTIHEHFTLAHAFRELPWTPGKKKPSLARYREIIAEARNRAFHSLIPVGRAIEVDLSGMSLHTRRLRIFPAYGRRTATEPLDYEDRELVDVLRHFTHAPEVTVPLRFWERNLDVMRGVQRLLDSTLDALCLMWETAG